MFAAKNPTAGRHTAAVKAPPLAAIKVSIKGKINCIWVFMAEIQSIDTWKHSVNTINKGIKAATYVIK